MIRICLHGAESTGKSVLAARLGLPWVPEYGREYAETNGTDFTMADLLAIAAGQDRAMRKAMGAGAAARPPVLLLDTDPLMTAAWAEMLFGTIPPELLAYEKAEHYLLFAPDTPWVADGTRFFGTPELRAKFAATAERMLDLAQVPFTRIAGDWAEREAAVRAEITRLTG